MLYSISDFLTKPAIIVLKGNNCVNDDQKSGSSCHGMGTIMQSRWGNVALLSLHLVFWTQTHWHFWCVTQYLTISAKLDFVWVLKKLHNELNLMHLSERNQEHKTDNGLDHYNL